MLDIERPCTFEEVKEAVCSVIGYVPKLTRDAKSVRARDLIVAVCRKTTLMSYPEIAEKLGYMSHTTAIDAGNRGMRCKDLRKVIEKLHENQKRCEKNPKMWAVIAKLVIGDGAE